MWTWSFRFSSHLNNHVEIKIVIDHHVDDIFIKGLRRIFSRMPVNMPDIGHHVQCFTLGVFFLLYIVTKSWFRMKCFSVVTKINFEFYQVNRHAEKFHLTISKNEKSLDLNWWRIKRQASYIGERKDKWTCNFQIRYNCFHAREKIWRKELEQN